LFLAATRAFEPVALGCEEFWMARSPREVFYKLVYGVAEGRWEELPQLYAEDTHVVHPFDPLRPKPLRSRDALREHFAHGADSGPSALSREPANITIHETADPEVIVAEFEYHDRRTDTGEAFSVPCIFVLRVSDGEIVDSRDYIDHLASARAQGRLDEFLDMVKNQPANG
jgi:uncharacterized protein